MGRARVLQHRRGRVRSLGGFRAESAGAAGGRPRWTGHALLVWRASARLESTGKSSDRARCARWRARGDSPRPIARMRPRTIATYKVGAIAVPLFSLFGVDALRYRLADSGAVVVLTDQQGSAKIDEIRADLPELRHVVTIDGERGGCIDLHAELVGQSDAFSPAETARRDPALHHLHLRHHRPAEGRAACAPRAAGPPARRGDVARLLLPQPGDRIWTPADWAWIGGLLDVLLPACITACRSSRIASRNSTREAAFELMARSRRPQRLPAADRAEDDARGARSRARWQLACARSRAAARRWARSCSSGAAQTFGLTINEFYGQTECNMIVSSCARAHAGAPGRRWAGRAGPRRRRSSTTQGAGVPAGDARPHRGAAARSGDVPGILEQPGGDARPSSSATG